MCNHDKDRTGGFMRLWHYDLIRLIPDSQLLGQHRECCALRGKGWGRKHFVVDYVFQYPSSMLAEYHDQIIMEACLRDFVLNAKWFTGSNDSGNYGRYPEHDNIYLSECLHNLKYATSYATKQHKGIDLFAYFPGISDQGCYDKVAWDAWFRSGMKNI
jgi:uncharacterized protein (TIGR02328 family)